MERVAGPESQTQSLTVTLREIEAADAAPCAQICFEAFGAIHDQHRFPRDFPALEMAAGMMEALISNPSIWGVVAAVDGRVVGSNFLHEADPIAGVGPVTVDPEYQHGVGRSLMEAVIERGKQAPGIRLAQDAFNMRSLSLYESLGFDVKEPLAVVGGKPRSRPVDRTEVRPLTEDDLDACEVLCCQVHGYDRTDELRGAIQALAPWVGLRDGSIVAYLSNATHWISNHGVAKNDAEMKALLLGVAAAVEEPLSFLVPLRGGLFRWCLEEGLRLVKPLNLMARGSYEEPTGAWFPSVLY
jgi:ribosomal protein S18 acetylase RimI-like enzyme